MEAQLRLFPVFFYIPTFWGFFKVWQTSITVTEDKLIAKACGFIKFREIQLAGIQVCEYIEKKWIRKGLSWIYMPVGISLIYEKNARLKTDYVVASCDQLKELADSLRCRNIPMKRVRAENVSG